MLGAQLERAPFSAELSPSVRAGQVAYLSGGDGRRHGGINRRPEGADAGAAAGGLHRAGVPARSLRVHDHGARRHGASGLRGRLHHAAQAVEAQHRAPRHVVHRVSVGRGRGRRPLGLRLPVGARRGYAALDVCRHDLPPASFVPSGPPVRADPRWGHEHRDHCVEVAARKDAVEQAHRGHHQTGVLVDGDAGAGRRQREFRRRHGVVAGGRRSCLDGGGQG